MWEVPLETQQSEDVTNNILDQATKLEPTQSLNAERFSPTTASLFKKTKQGLLKTWTGLT